MLFDKFFLCQVTYVTIYLLITFVLIRVFIQLVQLSAHSANERGLLNRIERINAATGHYLESLNHLNGVFL